MLYEKVGFMNVGPFVQCSCMFSYKFFVVFLVFWSASDDTVENLRVVVRSLLFGFDAVAKK